MRESPSLQSVISYWRSENFIGEGTALPVLNVADVVGSFFNPGHYYYFILDFFDMQVEYVHTTVKDIIGCSVEDFSLQQVFNVMHPDDAKIIPNKEAAAGEFFYKKIPPSKICLYKSSYTFRVKDGNGNWKVILHQSLPINMTSDYKIHHSLSVHTDITFLNTAPDDRISFIGLAGEPSYYSLSTDPNAILTSDKGFGLSDREKEIIKYLTDGLASKQIADILHISVHTVDTHRRNLLKKTGAKNTLELAATCLKKGLI